MSNPAIYTESEKDFIERLEKESARKSHFWNRALWDAIIRLIKIIREMDRKTTLRAKCPSCKQTVHFRRPTLYG